MTIFCKLCFVFLHIKLSPKYQLAEKLPFAEQMIFHSSYSILSLAVIFSRNRSQQTFLKVRIFFLTLINTEFEMMEISELVAHYEGVSDFQPLLFIAYDSVWVRAHHFCSTPLCPF